MSSVRYTADATFVLTASEDFNLRVWKARASQRLGPISRREALAVDYRAKLVERHAHMPQVKRLVRRRNLPKMVKKLRDRRDEDRQRRREYAITLRRNPGEVLGLDLEVAPGTGELIVVGFVAQDGGHGRPDATARVLGKVIAIQPSFLVWWCRSVKTTLSLRHTI